MIQLVLSLFPGMDILGMAFEAEGFCVARGPEKMFGSDVKNFHPPAGRFDGVIGGPPCQAHSSMKNIVAANGGKIAEDLVPEFIRCVREAAPAWWLMENVPLLAWDGAIEGWHVHSFKLNNRHVDAGDGFGPKQNRVRRFWFGHRQRKINLLDAMKFAALDNGTFAYSVLASNPLVYDSRRSRDRAKRGGRSLCINGKTVRRSLELQGIPPSLADGTPFTLRGLQRLVGNGVPMTMGRALAAAVRDSLAAVPCNGAHGTAEK